MFIEPPQMYFILKTRSKSNAFFNLIYENHLNKSSFFDLVIFDIEES